MGDVNLEIKLNNIDERVIKIEESGGSGGDGYITSVSNDFNVLNKKLSLSNDVTTKLPKSVPTTSDAGKVATVQSDGTVDWETPSASITEPTDLEKGIIGGDEWVSGGSYTIGKSVVIDENKLYLLVGDGGSTTKPSTDTTHLIWEETSISALSEEISDLLNHTFASVTTDKLANPNIYYYRTGKLVYVYGKFDVTSGIPRDNPILYDLPLEDTVPGIDLGGMAIISHYGNNGIYTGRLSYGKLYTDAAIPQGETYFISMTYFAK